MTRHVLWVSNDNVCELSGLQNTATGEYINGATVAVTILDGEDAIEGPIAMSYVAESDGVYRGPIADSADLTRNQRYTARITADAGPGLFAQIDVPVWARTRTS